MPQYPVAETADEAALSRGPFYGCLADAQRRTGARRLALVTERLSTPFPDRQSAESLHRGALDAGRASLLELTAGWAVHFEFWRPLLSDGQSRP